jgi:hypothetical protein
MRGFGSTHLRQPRRASLGARRNRAARHPQLRADQTLLHHLGPAMGHTAQLPNSYSSAY